MKKLPLCTLAAGVLFVGFGVRAVYQLGNGTEPFGMLVPLAWNIVMVGIGLGLIFRCEVARRAGIVWSYFCIGVSIAMGAGMLVWILRHTPETGRVVFTVLTYAFGVIFGFWQLHVLRSPDTLDWTKSRGEESHPKPHLHHRAGL